VITSIIKSNKATRLAGGFNILPMPFPRLSKYVAGFRRGVNVCLSASSGVGKTTLAKFMLISFVDWSIKYDIPLQVKYFALEESKEIFLTTVVIHKLHSLHGIRIDLDDILSNREKPISDDIIQKIEDIERDYISLFLERVEIIDYIDNPTGIYKHCREALEKLGTIEYTEIEKDDKIEKIPTGYSYNDPNQYFIIFIDHLGELSGENGGDLAASMQKMSGYMLKHLCKRFHSIGFNVHQQAGDVESVDNFKHNKLKPSLTGLGDNKKIGRAYRLCIGLFDPKRHEIPQYKGWDMGKIGDYFRSLTIFKNNFGPSNIEVPIYFDGMTYDLKELPETVSDAVYSKISNLKKTEY